MYQEFYLSEVENDIAEAKRWYAEQQAGLEARLPGNRFWIVVYKKSFL